MTNDSLSDSDLIERSRSEPSLFKELFERHFDDLFRYLAHGGPGLPKTLLRRRSRSRSRSAAAMRRWGRGARGCSRSQRTCCENVRGRNDEDVSHWGVSWVATKDKPRMTVPPRTNARRAGRTCASVGSAPRDSPGGAGCTPSLRVGRPDLRRDRDRDRLPDRHGAVTNIACSPQARELALAYRSVLPT